MDRKSRLRSGREVNVKENLAMTHLHHIFLLTLRLIEDCMF